jgi:hypothetical protein
LREYRVRAESDGASTGGSGDHRVGSIPQHRIASLRQASDLMTLLGRLFAGVVIIATTIGIALVIHSHVRGPRWRWFASLVPLVVVGASLALLPMWPWALAVWAGLVLVTILWWRSLRPQADRDWKTEMDVLPHVELAGEVLRVCQFRNFRYTVSGDPLPQYEERTFDLTKLASLDYVLAHWSGPAIAHSLVSFGFDDGQFLVLSIEARLQRGHSYSPLRGLCRSYELIYVLGDERDIIQLRTNIRRERVYLYRVRMPRQEVRQLLVDYLARVAKLAERPEWYNSFISNCTTNLFYHGRRSRVPWWLTPNIFLNGYSARAMYLRGFLDNSVPFEELQSRSDIRTRALAAGDVADFSQQIRTHIDRPGP